MSDRPGTAYSSNRLPPPGHEGVRSHALQRPPEVPALQPDTCPHEHVAVRADMNRVTGGLVADLAAPVIGYDLEIAVDCVACGTPFEFLGLPPGLSPRYPTGTFDGLTMSAPLRPYGSPPEWGLDRPGFSVEVWQANNDEQGEQPGTETE
jgi:hypothetical protein